ncbi:hypothetical protein QQF64_025753 [Cirrhinus molitorella]|uniref:AIG1-type G domain-containing protein n=1 Tax=Cirrhinus molitorella TaxID=172907 RepID=A0ABR3NQC7_9TELE
MSFIARVLWSDHRQEDKNGHSFVKLDEDIVKRSCGKAVFKYSKPLVAENASRTERSDLVPPAQLLLQTCMLPCSAPVLHLFGCALFKMDKIFETGLNLVLLGKTGAGKSSTGNTILGRQAFVSKKSPKSVTREVAVESGLVGHIPVTVYDTPGLFDTDMSEDKIKQNLIEVLQKCESGPCVFLLVIKADRFTEEERKTVEKIEKLLGQTRAEKPGYFSPEETNWRTKI